jgi:hypothetical protein
MTLDTHPQAVTATAMMTVVVAAEATEDVTTIGDTAEMIVTVATAEIATMDMPLAESIAMLVMTDIAAVVTSVVEAVVDTPIVMREEVTVAPLARLRQQPPMVIQLLVERLGNHTEVEATMMRDSPVENIDC